MATIRLLIKSKPNYSIKDRRQYTYDERKDRNIDRTPFAIQIDHSAKTDHIADPFDIS